MILYSCNNFILFFNNTLYFGDVLIMCVAKSMIDYLEANVTNRNHAKNTSRRSREVPLACTRGFNLKIPMITSTGPGAIAQRPRLWRSFVLFFD